MSKELGTCREFSKAQIAELESLRDQNLAQAARIKELETQHTSDGIVIFQLDSALRLANEKWVTQASVIEKYKNTVLVLEDFAGTVGGSSSFWTDYYPQFSPDNFPTDSKQILAEWLDKALGEPRSYLYKHIYHDGSFVFSHKPTFQGNTAVESIPLFKKPEIK